MLQAVALFGLVAFVAASLVVGGRILLLARRTRGLPEILIGTSLFVAGGIGTGLAIVPLIFPKIDAESAHLVYQISSIASHAGYAVLFLFVWRVFRRGTPWAAVLCLACIGTLAIGAAGLGLSLETGESLARPEGPARTWLFVSLAARFVGYTWAAFESFRYYAMLRRRIAIGLADAATARRFYYWGVCTTAVVMIWLNLAVEQALPAVDAYAAITQSISAALGFIVAGSLSVAFFPRRSTEHQTESGATADGASGRA